MKAGDIYFNRFTGETYKVKRVVGAYVVCDKYISGVKVSNDNYINAYKLLELKKLHGYQLALDFNKGR